MTVPLEIQGGETGFDQVLAFLLPEKSARGRLVRLGPTLDTMLDAHDYPTVVRRLLAEALVLAALMGSLLKDDTCQLTMQAQSRGGPIDLLVCDYRLGELRGYVRFDEERVLELEGDESLDFLFGTGHLAITFDIGSSDQRYQGIVPLEGASLTHACENYFAQSEQVPTVIRFGISDSSAGCIAGGLLLQYLPEGEEGRERLHVKIDHPQWEHVAVLGGSLKPDELVDPSLSLEGLVWRLFHDEGEIRIEQMSPLVRGCRCSADYYVQVLSRFSEEDRIDMRGDDGLVTVDCAFCSKLFKLAI